MKYSLVIREDAESQKVADVLKNRLVNLSYTEKAPDIVIVIGGDGTMVKAFHEYKECQPYYVCIGTGTLGFYADWEKEEVEELAAFLMQDEKPHVSYPLVEAELTLADGTKRRLVALNELVVKSNNTSTFVMNTYLNGELFEAFRGDGMVFATPSGSTAYNHSLMGSVVHPSLACVQVTGLAPINNAIYRSLNRPLVLPSHHVLRGDILSAHSQVVAGVDNQITFDGTVTGFEVRVSDETVRFLRYRDFAFWKRVKEKFL